MLTCDQYHMPQTLKEALVLWNNAPDGSRLVAGATDILPWAREGRAGDVHLPAMIDVTKVAELNGYKVADGRVRLGANVVFQQFLEDDTLREHLPCMPYCSVWFADDQIRQQATLAGNIVNASPAADGTPPVLAMNGEIELARLEGESVAVRTLAVQDFVQGPGRTALQPGEIITAVTCDSMAGYGGSFEKVGQRRSLVISAVCATALVMTDPAGQRLEDIRLAIGGIGPVPLRLADIEDKLRSKTISRELITEVSMQPPALVASRTRREYRRWVVRGFVQAAIEDALADAGHPIAPALPKEAEHV